MAISVVCDSCEAPLKVGDHLAGKKVKCPKCSAIVSVPAEEEPEEEQVTARPSKSGRKAPPPDEDEDERPARKSRAREEDDEEVDEDRPVRKSRRREEDEEEEEDDRPSRKRRRDDDEDEDDRPARKPKKKKKKGSGKIILLILGLVGGVFVLCCGGFGVWFYTTYNSANANVNKENWAKLGSAKTLSEVSMILGPSKVASEDDVNEAFKGITAGPMGPPNQALTKNSNAATLYRWRNKDEWIFASVKNDTQQVIVLMYVLNRSTGGATVTSVETKLPNGLIIR